MLANKNPATMSPFLTGANSGIQWRVSADSAFAATTTAALDVAPLAQTTRGGAPACSRCLALKRQCIGADGSRCERCDRFEIPQHLCVRDKLPQMVAFEKWNDPSYINKFTAGFDPNPGQPICVQLSHYQDPVLTVLCVSFNPVLQHQRHALRKNSSGWHIVPTSAYCLAMPVDIPSYVRSCVRAVVQEASEIGSIVRPIFQIARLHERHPAIRGCLQLYTALRLMRIGWKFSGRETLGMVPVDDENSAWHMLVPVPRMIQNQLNHMLEEYMMDLDRQVLSEVQKLFRSGRQDSVLATLAVILLLHIREIDAGRNMYWDQNQDAVFDTFWIHPSKPAKLIEQTSHSAHGLLCHFHSTVGHGPLNQDWSLDKSKKLLGNDNLMIKTVQALQKYRDLLANLGLIGKRAADVYEKGDPNSVKLTMSSLVFASGKDDGILTLVKSA